jgi:hypothetical protein
MKKINFEKLSNAELFGSFASNKLNSLQASSLRGGAETSTSLCKTVTTSSDSDNNGTQENLKDSRCTGY